MFSTRSSLLALALLCGPGLAQSVSSQPLGPTPPGGDLGCAPRPLALPSYIGQLDLVPWQGCGGGGWPFSQAYSPDGTRLYVTLFGGVIGSGGCTVLRLDPDTYQVLATIPTGEGPEELAFVSDRTGALQYGFVTNSSASSVTVFDGADQVVATIPIPFDAAGAFPTAFPFGLAVDADQEFVYVGTGGGEGWVYAIDVSTLSLDPARSIQLGAGLGVTRLRFHDGRLLLPVTEYLPGFTGSATGLVVLDPLDPASAVHVALGSANDGTRFPSLQEVVVDCRGRAWVAGFDLGAAVFEVDLDLGAVVGSLPTQTSNGLGKFQACGLSEDGLLVVGDLWTNELALIDVRRRVSLGTIDGDLLPAPHRGPQEVRFDPTRGRLTVVWAATEDLTWFDL